MEGMASAEVAEGKSFHGVLHLMSKEHMEILDKIEFAYFRSDAIAKLYNGEELTCTVYIADPEKNKELAGDNVVNNPPSERYIDIMTEGA